MSREPFVLIDTSLTRLRSGNLIISGAEAQHLTQVLRIQTGHRIIGIDGQGSGWHAEIIARDRHTVTARILEPLAKPPDERYEFSVAVGVIKGSRMEWAIEKAAELGATRFLPLITRYNVVSPGEGRLQRWQTIALSAAKQSHRLRLMEIVPPISLEQAIQEEKRDPNDTVCVLHMGSGSTPLTDYWNNLVRSTEAKRLTLLIGPEGGFAPDELELFRASYVPAVSIGRHPLRTETAVAVALGTLRNLVLS